MELTRMRILVTTSLPEKQRLRLTNGLRETRRHLINMSVSVNMDQKILDVHKDQESQDN